MAMIWSWAFGNETKADLESVGFSFVESFGAGVQGPVSSAVDPLNAYTYSGSPTRYGWEFDTSVDGNNGRYQTMSFPSPSLPTNKGIVAIAHRGGAAVFGPQNRDLITVSVTLANSFRVQTFANTGTAALYVDGNFKGTSAAVDVSNWNYFVLVFDCSSLVGGDFTGSFYLNGNLEVSGSDVRNTGIYTVNGISWSSTQSGSFSGTNILGQIITYDDPVADLADAVSPDNFVTRIVPNADAGTVGTWTSTGVPDPASGTDGATGTPDTTFTSASATFTSTIGPVGVVTGYTLTIGVTTVAIQEVVSDTELLVATGLGAGLTSQTYSVQDTNLFSAVKPPIDNTTYAGITAPASLDRLEVDTANGTDLQTLLGINPSSIKGATVHSVSLATAGTAKIGIQEGGSETLSAAQPVQTSDTYLAESVANNPSTGLAWDGADQPILVYEITTV